ncbi:glutamine amidotransferase [Bradyrhizobium sp. NP1]|uniref:glutamine amidotransferase n=1 Tax=Bradyrhizobium sp. NP1 TaxID=3049772 RepID=UPI0025A68D32|nr:glutamine amidotransferase [Bradyrhizobium sp. NP1]WJR80752.1 glutamine amidotransferase [Bradyrhizobium sp. NP1]
MPEATREKRALAIRHLAFEDLGTIADILDQRGYRTTYREAGVDDLAAVELAEDDLFIVLGGPIGAYEEHRYPFLAEELRLIERALRRRSRVLGICLGAQLLARALGARVYPGRAREIGIGAIALTPEGRDSCLGRLAPDPLVLHWHGDTFDLPAGTVRLASTEITPNQAFAHENRVLGLQFHIEAAPRGIERWLIGHTFELGSTGIDVMQLRRELQAQLPAIAARGRDAMAAWIEASETA